MQTFESGYLRRGRVRFKIIVWDDGEAAVPMNAGEVPQASANRYAGRPAGSLFESGTFGKYEDARPVARLVFV